MTEILLDVLRSVWGQRVTQRQRSITTFTRSQVTIRARFDLSTCHFAPATLIQRVSMVGIFLVMQGNTRLDLNTCSIKPTHLDNEFDTVLVLNALWQWTITTAKYVPSHSKRSRTHMKEGSKSTVTHVMAKNKRIPGYSLTPSSSTQGCHIQPSSSSHPPRGNVTSTDTCNVNQTTT